MLFVLSRKGTVLNMKKNRFLSFLLAGCLLFTGCSGGEDQPETTTDGNTYVDVTDEEGKPVTNAEGEVVTSVIPAVPEEKELTVGFVYSGKAGGDAVSEYFEDARAEIARVLGAKTYYVENVLVSQFEAATAVLVEKGCNVIVSTSVRYANAVYDEATGNKKVHFVSYGGTKAQNNLSCFQGEVYKGAFVCGLAAAYNSDSNIIGVVADPAVISVYNVIDGFIIGAKELTKNDTDVRVNWAWGNRDQETKDAIDNLISQGCDVIFTATGSRFAVQYCELKGIKVIGLSYNMPDLAPENYITGTFCNVKLFLIDVLRSVRYGTDGVEVYRGGIKEGAVRVVAINEKAREGTKEICDTLYQLCEQGKALVFKDELKDTNGNIKVKKGETLDADKIMGIDWLEQSVKSENNYCEPLLDPVGSDLTVYEDKEQAAGTDAEEAVTAA